MKKVSIILIMFFILFVGMINVDAWIIYFEQDAFGGYVYGERLNPGEDIPFLLMPEKDASETLGDFTVIATITYDTSVFEFKSYDDNYSYYDVNVQNGKVVVKFSSNALKNLSYLALNFRAKSSITSNVSGKISLDYENNGVPKNITETLNVIMPSSNALLSSLSIKEGVLSPNFNSNVFKYTSTVNSETLNIECEEADKNAYSSYCNKNDLFGGYILNYGINNFDIKVTAEDGTIKTYKLAITRPDDRSSDSTLKNITLSNGSIDFNSSKKDYNVNVTSSSVTVNASKNDANAKVEYPNGNTVNLGYGETKTVKIKVTAENGSSSTYSVTLTRKDTRSSDSSLKSITLSNGNIDFNSSKKDYNVNVISGSVTVNATKNNANAKLEYLGGNTVYLGYGESKTVKIKVTSEKGTSSIYSVTLTRIDTRSNDVTLKSLTVSNTNIKFNKSTTYNAQVENNISKVEIKATANNSKATISGAGTKSLKVGNNSFIIAVTAENGDAKNYIVIVNRKAKASEKNETIETKLSSDNYLKFITIDEIQFDFDKDILDYDLFVDYDVTNINLEYVSSSDKAFVTMSGTTDLEVGLNVIDLIVVAENGSVKTYTLNVTRWPERLVAENNDEEILGFINSDSYDDIYVIDEQINAPYIISSEVLSALKDTGKTLIYEIMNDDAILYQLKFVGGELENTDDFKFEVLFETTRPQKLESIINSENYLPIRFNTKGEALNGVHLSLYTIAKDVVDEDFLKLYEFDIENEKLDLISSNLDINENVISLEIDDLTKEYILTNNVGKKVSNDVITKEKNINLPVIIGISIFIILILTFLIIKKAKSKNKTKTQDETNLNNLPNQEFNNIDSLEDTSNYTK